MSTACATLKIAAFAPIASVTVAIMPMLKAGALSIARMAYRRSWMKARITITLPSAGPGTRAGLAISPGPVDVGRGDDTMPA